MTGLHLSHYAIESEIGRGGMGVVFKARDTKLNRAVALKVLPASALASPDDRARFVREAQSAAQLNHPNVCHVYEVDEAQPRSPDGALVEGHTEARLFIAMEFIEGETLAERVKTGPLSVREAVTIAGQVAEALKDAHAKEIVHRDIKSANIMLTGSGVVKVLDFGLAKTNQSTMLTRMGSTLGTVSYMSPEQARGQEVDGRSDLYSLGTVLYEMVAGRLPFGGDYEQAVIYSILNEPPVSLTGIRTGVPMKLEWVVDKLLKKEAEFRYQSAAGLLADLKSLDLGGSGLSGPVPVGPAEFGAQPTGQPWRVWAGMALVALMASGGTWLATSTRSPDRPGPAHLQVTLPNAVPGSLPDWSPDETRILYAASTDVAFIAEYDLRTGRSRRIPGTDHGTAPHYSPDESQIFFKRGRSVMRVATTSDRAVLVADSADSSVMTWIDRDRVVFARESGPTMYDSRDGVLTLLDRTPEGMITTLGAVSSPDGRFVYYVGWDEGPSEGWVYDRRAGVSTKWSDERILTVGMTSDWMLGYLHGVGGDASFRRMSPKTGLPVGAAISTFNAAGSIGFDVSASGHLLSQPEVLASDGLTELTRIEALHRVGQNGLLTELGNVPSLVWNEFSISPDGRTAVVEANIEGGSDGTFELYAYDLETRASRRLLPDRSLGEPEVVANGRVYFHRLDGDTRSVYRLDMESGIEPEILVSSGADEGNPAVSADERTLLFQRFDADTGWDIWIKDLETGEERELIAGPEDETNPTIAPDGSHFAIERQTNSGVRSVVLGRVRDGNTVSLGEGIQRPRYAHNGRYLLYTDVLSTTVFRLNLSTEDPLSSAFRPVVAYADPQQDHLHFAPNPGLDPLIVSFYINTESGTVADTETWSVVLNWASTLNQD